MTTKDSNLIANPALQPPVMNSPGKVRGAVLIAQDNFEVAVGDLDAADIIRLARLPANAVLQSIKLTNDDLGTTLTVNVGIYTTAGVVKDVDAFATAYSLAGAGQTRLTEVMVEAGTDAQKALIGDPLWAWALDTSEPTPGTEYDICLTVASSSSPAAGTIGFRIRYTLA